MRLEKHGRRVEQAWQMLDVFASLGAHTFDLTRTDMDGHKRDFRPAQSLEALQRWMPSLLRSATQWQHNLIVRPKPSTAALVQLDDLRGTMLERVRRAAFLILTTSAGNHQAWVAVREDGPDFSGADPSASGATRVAGSVNFKRQYGPDFPMVRILEATPQRTVTRSELEALGLVAAPDAVPVVRPGRGHRGRRATAWPSYERCLQNAPPRHHSERPDVSRADFTFCLLAIDWGWSLAETYERLLEKSSKAHENGERYARLTAERAAAAVDRRCGRFEGMNRGLSRPAAEAEGPGQSAGCEHSFVDARVSAEPAIAL